VNDELRVSDAQAISLVDGGHGQHLRLRADLQIAPGGARDQLRISLRIVRPADDEANLALRSVRIEGDLESAKSLRRAIAA
jgi:hypothetical protein